MIDKFFGIVGLIFIIAGNLTIYRNKITRKKYTYPLLILGGLFLLFYSLIIKDFIFIILQSFFVLASIYGLIKIKHKNKK